MRLGFLDRLLPRKRPAPAPPAPPSDDMPETPAWQVEDGLCLVRMRNGALVFVDPRDESLGVPVRAKGEWEPHVTRILERLLRPGDRVIDVGSNIGCHVVTMARAIGDGGALLAIEANPRVAELLRCTVAVNRLRQVRIVEAAVLDRPGTVELYVHDRDLGGGAVGRPGWEAVPVLREHRRYRGHGRDPGRTCRRHRRRRRSRGPS